MSDNGQKSLIFCSLLALQFGLQPIIATRFTASGVSKSSIVIVTEITKIVIAALSVFSAPKEERKKIWSTWTLGDSLRAAAVPATLYAIQNLLVQYGYVYLDSMSFNLLNQTKTLSAAFWLWVLLGKKQSHIQMVALFLLLLAAVVLNMAPSSPNSASNDNTDNNGVTTEYQFGLFCVASASMLSGLSAALTQRALSGTQSRHTMLYSAEMAVYGIVFLLGNLMVNSDIQAGSTLWAHWDLSTMLPVITNAFGGMVVGLVTKYAGGVVKGFALIAGINVTGLAQFLLDGKPLGAKDFAGVVLVSVAIFLHSKYPYVEKAVQKKSE
eukprot:gene16310-18612_t